MELVKRLRKKSISCGKKMAPKKFSKRNHQPKGPYYFFMMEFKKKQEGAGHVFRRGMHEVQQRASPYWNVSMTVFHVQSRLCCTTKPT